MRKAGKSTLTGVEDTLAYAQSKATYGQAHRLKVRGAVDVKAIHDWEEGRRARENTSAVRAACAT